MHNNNDYKRGQAYEQEGGGKSLRRRRKGKSDILLMYENLKSKNVLQHSFIEKYYLCSSSLKESWFNSTLAKQHMFVSVS